MELLVDRDRCIGAGQCVNVAPEVFDQHEDDGTVVLLSAHPAPEHHEGALQAELLCPARAITAAREQS